MEQGTCIGCNRRIYKVGPSVGTPSEWRHNSTAHPVSWQPERHVAGHTLTTEHQHKWGKPNKERVKRCSIELCDSEVIEMRWTPPAEMSERERKQHQSRLRGASARNYRPPKSASVS